MDTNIFEEKKNNSATVRIIADSPVMKELFEALLFPVFKKAERHAFLTVVCCEKDPPPQSGRCIYVGTCPEALSKGQLFFSRPLDIEAFYRTCLEISRSLTVSRGLWSYDTATGKAFYKESSVSLTAKEGELFALLLSRADECVSRDEIEEILWRGSVSGNCADVYVCYLRKKLERIAAPGALLSVRGQGYMLKKL